MRDTGFLTPQTWARLQRHHKLKEPPWGWRNLHQLTERTQDCTPTKMYVTARGYKLDHSGCPHTIEQHGICGMFDQRWPASWAWEEELRPLWTLFVPFEEGEADPLPIQGVAHLRFNLRDAEDLCRFVDFIRSSWEADGFYEVDWDDPRDVIGGLSDLNWHYGDDADPSNFRWGPQAEYHLSLKNNVPIYHPLEENLQGARMCREGHLIHVINVGEEK
jgi:hypothetical protein